MVESVPQESRRRKRVADMQALLQRRFPEVEHVGASRFLIWGSTRFKHRPYLEIWFDDDFLDQEGDDLQASTGWIVAEAEAILNSPDLSIRKQGEILASGRNGITARRGLDIYRIEGS
jgi:hypothetical protein